MVQHKQDLLQIKQIQLTHLAHPFGSAEAAADSMFGVTNTGSEASGGLYGAGRFGYSINDVTTTTATATTASITSASVNFDSTFTDNNLAQYAILQINTASLSGFDDKGVRAFVPSSGSHIAEIYPAFTKLESTAW
jgi:hypothetical protein